MSQHARNPGNGKRRFPHTFKYSNQLCGTPGLQHNRPTWRVPAAAAGPAAGGRARGSEQRRAPVERARHARPNEDEVQVHARQQRAQLQERRPLARLLDGAWAAPLGLQELGVTHSLQTLLTHICHGTVQAEPSGTAGWIVVRNREMNAGKSSAAALPQILLRLCLWACWPLKASTVSMQPVKGRLLEQHQPPGLSTVFSLIFNPKFAAGDRRPACLNVYQDAEVNIMGARTQAQHGAAGAVREGAAPARLSGQPVQRPQQRQRRVHQQRCAAARAGRQLPCATRNMLYTHFVLLLNCEVIIEIIGLGHPNGGCTVQKRSTMKTQCSSLQRLLHCAFQSQPVL